ncbi:MAG TPA: glycosyltransferase [Verrucomicrobiae bacterium]|nr:glycosyltransferase [Verrucomicrobiae bacterium]
MILNLLLGALAVLSLVLLLWQWFAARRFPLHQRQGGISGTAPAITLFKPLKGCDAATESCLRSWFTQNYSGEIQLLFAVVSNDDPVCEVVRKLIGEFSHCDAKLVIVPNLIGANAKVSKLAELEKRAKHELICISDADVRVPPDFLSEAVAPLRQPEMGLVNCFYRLANPTTLAMRWEAIAINADFWSQVLQSKTLKPLDFALGAVMLTRRKQLNEIGGFAALADCLADDYQLGNRIGRKGHHIALCPLVAECWDPPMTWRAVWKHQLRWARTIRVCQPAPYFFSILSNPTLWPLIWATTVPSRISLCGLALALILRMVAAIDLQQRLTRSFAHVTFAWLAPIKDLLQTAIWLSAFAGNTIEWRGQKFFLRRDGTLTPVNSRAKG